MDHWSEEVRVQRRVTETFLEPVSVGVGSLRVDFGLSELVLGGDVVPELVQESAIDESFEGEDKNDGWKGSDPVKGPETELKADCEAHQGLHQDDSNQETVDNDVP